MTTPDLRPCPFCGGEAKLSGAYTIQGVTAWAVYCGRTPSDFSCGAQITSIESEGKAVEAWNRRTSDEMPSRKPEDCLYYTANSFWGGGCLGTKEIDPCKGDDCKNWKPKEDKR